MPVRVLHIIDHMRFGGAQRIVAALADHQPYTWIYAVRWGSATDMVEPRKGRLYSGPGNILAFFVAFPNLVRLIRREQIDIVHCHLRLGFFIGLVLAYLFRRRDRPRFVFHEHGPILFGWPIYRFLVSRVTLVGTVVTCSHYVKDAIVKAGISGDVRTILNFVDEHRFQIAPELRRAFRQKLRVHENTMVIGFAGRLVREKGCYELVQAFSRLPADENVKLLIAGNGNDADRIRNYMEDNHLSSHVEMLGYVSDMNEFYNGIDVFVIPSFREPLGMVQLEAQFCGKPVAASDIPGIRETVDATNALLFQPGDIDALAAALRRIISDRILYASLAASGVRNAANFLFARYLEQIDLLYGSVLNRESHDTI